MRYMGAYPGHLWYIKFINPKPIGLRGKHPIACSGKPHPSKRQGHLHVAALRHALHLFSLFNYTHVHIALNIEYRLCVWSGRQPSFTVSKNKRGPDDWENPSLPPHCGPSPNSVSAPMRCSGSSNSVMWPPISDEGGRGFGRPSMREHWRTICTPFVLKRHNWGEH